MGYQWVDDGVEAPQHLLGGAGYDRYEIGDAIRGMQGSPDMVGAAQLRALKSQLSPGLAGRFAPHQPATKAVPSQYRDSGQLGIVISKTITLSSPTYDTWQNAQLNGQTTVFTSFKPARAVVTEKLIVTFTNTAGASTVVANVSDASDLLLTGGFSGNINVFPNAPSAATGINCSSLQAQSFGVGISWPTVNVGVPVSVNLELEASALFQATPPSGYEVGDITRIICVVNFALYGAQLR